MRHASSKVKAKTGPSTSADDKKIVGVLNIHVQEYLKRSEQKYQQWMLNATNPESEVPAELRQIYKIEEKIGIGGFAAVYRCWKLEDKEDPNRKSFAMKLDKEDRKQFSRLRQEYEYLKRVTRYSSGRFMPRFDENNARKHGWGEQNGAKSLPAFYVMSLCEFELGYLRHILRKLSVPLSTWVGGEALKALEHVHRAGLIHRDLKPQNVMMRIDERGLLRVVLVDFGLATSYYATAEALRGYPQTPLDDIMGLWFVLMECVFGELPWWTQNKKHEAEERKEAAEMGRPLNSADREAAQKAKVERENKTFQAGNAAVCEKKEELDFEIAQIRHPWALPDPTVFHHPLYEGVDIGKADFDPSTVAVSRQGNHENQDEDDSQIKNKEQTSFDAYKKLRNESYVGPRDESEEGGRMESKEQRQQAASGNAPTSSGARRDKRRVFYHEWFDRYYYEPKSKTNARNATKEQASQMCSPPSMREWANALPRNLVLVYQEARRERFRDRSDVDPVPDSLKYRELLKNGVFQSDLAVDRPIVDDDGCEDGRRIQQHVVRQAVHAKVEFDKEHDKLRTERMKTMETGLSGNTKANTLIPAAQPIKIGDVATLDEDEGVDDDRREQSRFRSGASSKRVPRHFLEPMPPAHELGMDFRKVSRSLLEYKRYMELQYFQSNILHAERFSSARVPTARLVPRNFVKSKAQQFLTKPGKTTYQVEDSARVDFRLNTVETQYFRLDLEVIGVLLPKTCKSIPGGLRTTVHNADIEARDNRLHEHAMNLAHDFTTRNPFDKGRFRAMSVREILETKFPFVTKTAISLGLVCDQEQCGRATEGNEGAALLPEDDDTLVKMPVETDPATTTRVSIFIMS
eukprot:g5788.t1